MEEKCRFLFCFVIVLLISELLLKLVESVSDHYSIYLNRLELQSNVIVCFCSNEDQCKNRWDEWYEYEFPF